MKKYLKKKCLKINWVLSIYFSDIKEISIADEANLISKENLKKPLILVPHSDDEWIGCSQVIKNAHQCTVYYFNFLGNLYTKSNEEIRFNELISLKNDLNFDLVVSTDRKNNRDLQEIISKQNFSSIFIPCPIDWHEEHILTNKIILTIIKNLENRDLPFYFYEVTVPLPKKMQKKYLKLNKSDIIDKQTKFIQHYPSQKNIPIRRITTQNRISAKRSRFYAVESFGIIDFELWEKLLQDINTRYKVNYKPLIYNINSLRTIRKMSNKIYDKFLKSINHK